jgi:hypothetical protein
MTLGLQALGTALIHREIRVALMTVGLSCPTLAVRGRAIEDLRTGILTPGVPARGPGVAVGRGHAGRGPRGLAAGRALIRAARGVRCLPDSGQVVVPDGAADACTVPGWPCQIVNTAGMLDALDPAERQVLLAHFVAAANPLLRR